MNGQTSRALQVGDHRAAGANQIVRRNREHIVPRDIRSPHEIINGVVLQQIRVKEDSQFRAVTKWRHAAIGLGNLPALELDF